MLDRLGRLLAIDELRASYSLRECRQHNDGLGWRGAKPRTCHASRRILLGSSLVEFLERLSTLRAAAGLRMNGGGYSGVSPSALLRSRLAIGGRELDFKLMDLIPLGISSLTLRYRQKLLQASAGGHRLWCMHGRIIPLLDKSRLTDHRRLLNHCRRLDGLGVFGPH